MKLNEIMEIIHGAYPDAMTRNYWDSVRRRPAPGVGDTLAEFIVKEVFDTYDAEAAHSTQLTEAIRVLERARSDIGSVITALQYARSLPQPEDHVLAIKLFHGRRRPDEELSDLVSDTLPRLVDWIRIKIESLRIDWENDAPYLHGMLEEVEGCIEANKGHMSEEREQTIGSDPLLKLLSTEIDRGDKRLIEYMQDGRQFALSGMDGMKLAGCIENLHAAHTATCVLRMMQAHDSDPAKPVGAWLVEATKGAT